MGIEDIRDVLIIREGATTLVTDSVGNVPAGNPSGLGLYHADTRHLSTYNLSLNHIAPVVLLSTAELGYEMEQVMTNPQLASGDGRRIGKSSTEIRRQRVMSDVVEEHLRITNFNPFPIALDVLYEFAADFADIFDVRGYERHSPRHPAEPEVGEQSITYSYSGVDGRTRRTRIEFDRAPARIDATGALFALKLDAARRSHCTRASRSIIARGEPSPELTDSCAWSGSTAGGPSRRRRSSRTTSFSIASSRARSKTSACLEPHGGGRLVPCRRHTVVRCALRSRQLHRRDAAAGVPSGPRAQDAPAPGALASDAHRCRPGRRARQDPA